MADGEGTQIHVGGSLYTQAGPGNTMNIGVASPLAEPQPPPAPKVILILAANPRGTAALRLDEEQRAIDHAIQQGGRRERLEIRISPAMRMEDLQRALLQHRPAVIHFSGHGTACEGIVFSDQHGRPRTVPPRALSELFRIAGVADAIDCVLLNACLTQDQATAIAQHVPCVIGMSHLVPDETAIAFAEGFYRAVAFGHSVRTAFDMGVNAAVLEGLGGSDVPRLIAHDGVAEKMIIAS